MVYRTPATMPEPDTDMTCGDCGARAPFRTPGWGMVDFTSTSRVFLACNVCIQEKYTWLLQSKTRGEALS